MNDQEQKMAETLKPFGWTCTEVFWERYYTDPWVFNLANAVETLTKRAGTSNWASELCATAKSSPGWFCSRSLDHDGPCAAWPVSHATQPMQPKSVDWVKFDEWLDS